MGVIGASLVLSEVIVFMEPHCVVGRQWLEPLLHRLSETKGHGILVMPTIDIIPEEDFNGYKAARHHIGGFDWSLSFNWMDLVEDRNQSYRYPEFRHKECIGREYDLAGLPNVSLVIPYLNETWTQMRATVASMLAYTPLELPDHIPGVARHKQRP